MKAISAAKQPIASDFVEEKKKSSISEKLYENRLVILSFFLTALVMVLTYAIKGIYPFGDKTILKVDLYHQYAPFHEELRTRLLEGKSLFYSWQGGLGKEFLSQIYYYTSSPFSLLVLLFPFHSLGEAIAVLIVLRTALCGATCSYYLKNHFKRNDISILVFGLFYAFCSFMTGYYWNIMWIETVALFPLLALAIERLIHENKHTFYYVTLVITMIVNFYLAVFVCVFVALYYLVVLFSSYDWKRNSEMMLKRSVKFAILSILAAMTVLVILGPAAISLGQTSTSNTEFPNFEVYTNIIQIWVNHFLGAFPAVLARNEDVPNIYTGVLTILLVPQYFLNRKINKREKKLLLAMMIFMILCCCIKPLDFMIHGFHFTANLPHRFVFIYSFFLLYMAYTAFCHLEEIRWKTVGITILAYAALIILSEYALSPLFDFFEIDRILSDIDVVLNMVLLIIYGVIFYIILKKKQKPKTGVLLLLLALSIAECQYSSVEGLGAKGSKDAYFQYSDGAFDAVDYINGKEEEEGNLFARSEFRRFTTINDAALYGYNGFGIFSSMAPGGVSNLMQKLGVAAASNSYRHYDLTPLLNAFFDLKYMLNKDTELANTEHYQYLDTFGNVLLYENERILPIAFLVDPEIQEWNIEDTDPFQVQNDLIKTSTDVEKDMFEYIEADSVDVTYMNKTEERGPANFDYQLTNPADLSKEPTVTATYTSDRRQHLYLYVEAENAKRFIYHTNRENQDRELSCGRSLIDVGMVEEGEVITIEFAVTKRGEFEKTYHENGTVRLFAGRYLDEVFQEAYDELKENPMTLTSFEDTRIEGTVKADKDSVLFTSIPYIKGWHVFVDGEETEKVSIGNDGFIGVAIPEGEHTVRLEYHVKYLVPCILLSILGLILFFVYTKIDREKDLSYSGRVFLIPAYMQEVEEKKKFTRKNKKGKKAEEKIEEKKEEKQPEAAETAASPAAGPSVKAPQTQTKKKKRKKGR